MTPHQTKCRQSGPIWSQARPSGPSWRRRRSIAARPARGQGAEAPRSSRTLSKMGLGRREAEEGDVGQLSLPMTRPLRKRPSVGIVHARGWGAEALLLTQTLSRIGQGRRRGPLCLRPPACHHPLPSCSTWAQRKISIVCLPTKRNILLPRPPSIVTRPGEGSGD